MDKTNKYPNNKTSVNRILKAKEVAEILNVSRSFVYQLMQSGQIPTVRIGKTCRVRCQDFIH